MRTLEPNSLQTSKSVNLSQAYERMPGGGGASSAVHPNTRHKWLGACPLVLSLFLFLNFVPIDRLKAQGIGRAAPGQAVRMAAGTNGASRGSTSQETLIVTATIMPIGVVAGARPTVGGGSEILIDVPSGQLQTEETWEWTILAGRSEAALKTTTIVAR